MGGGERDDPTVETGTNAVGGRGRWTSKHKHGGRKKRKHTSDSDAESENSNTTKWGTKKRKAKKAMANDELCSHFLASLSERTIQGCGNKGCNCMKVMENERIRLAVAHYLAWFEKKEKLEQDTILLEWYKYAAPIKGKGRAKWYNLPYMADRSDIDSGHPVVEEMRTSHLCTRGMMLTLHVGKKRMQSKREAARTVRVMPPHQSKGRKSKLAVNDTSERGKVLKRHFEYLLQLGEV